MGTLATATCGVGDPVGTGNDPPQSGEPTNQLPRNLSSAESRLIEVDNSFALKLFREISIQQPDRNIFISPLSVAMALGMTYNGADGDTKVAMEQTLELQGMSVQEINEAYRDLIGLLVTLDSLVQLHLANSIWYREGMAFEQAFLDINKEYFNAEISSLDFNSPTAGNTINDWVRENTRGKIETIVPSRIPPTVVMYLINAIYFNGSWTYEFNKDLTTDQPFTLLDGRERTVSMMSLGRRVDLALFQTDLVEGIELPYGDQGFTMLVLLPRTEVHIDEVVGTLAGDVWQSWMSGLREYSTPVSMPKFTLEYEIQLNDVLAALGMGVAFTGGADFSKMLAGGGIWISEVRHKALVDVNEEGTEAAAATSVVMDVSAGFPVVDRPFLFVIREKYSGTIIFIGKVVDPEA
jgi:serpin B